MIASNCVHLSPIRPGLNSIWYRAVQLHHVAGKALGTAHTKGVASRFSAGNLVKPHRQFEILYLAETHHVALYEVEALLGSPVMGGGPIANPRQTWAVLNVTVRLSQVVDLTVVSEQAKVMTTAQELTGDWRGYQLRNSGTSVKTPTGYAPTQELGEGLYNSTQVEGFLTISAKVPDRMILVVFPERVRQNHPHSSIEFDNPITHTSESVL